MSVWLDRITADPADLTPVLLAYEHFDSEYETFRAELDENNLKGRRLISVSGRIPGLSEFVYAQWAQIGAIVEVLELRVQAATQKSRRFYTESYNRQLGSQQIEHYARADPEVLALGELLIRMNLVHAKWEAISKGVERLHHQLRSIVELRRAHMEDATL